LHVRGGGAAGDARRTQPCDLAWRRSPDGVGCVARPRAPLARSSDKYRAA
jgi:hypothetical protein